MRLPSPAGLCSLALIGALGPLWSGCGGASPRPARVPGTGVATAGSSSDPSEPGAGLPTVSARGGTPATGPGNRFNACQRIWCLTHGENFFIDHFLEGHIGWILHDEVRGDVFVTAGRTSGPEFPDARVASLRLCGRHVHPWILGRYGGPVRHTGFNLTLGYRRSHFNSYGTRLDPCCTNGLGWAFLHSSAGRHFRFHDVEEYRAHPDSGWQPPAPHRIARR